MSEEEQRVEWNEVRDDNSKILLLNYARLVKCFTDHISSFKQAQEKKSHNRIQGINLEQPIV